MNANTTIWTARTLLLLPGCSASNKSKNETTAPQAAPEQIEAMQKEADKVIEQEMAEVQQKEATP